MSAAATRRLSGLQRDVLHLYRASLRAARTKPAEYRANWTTFVQHEFRKTMDMHAVRDAHAIEHLVRVGRRRLETLRNPAIKNVHT
ncbi:hypothetical protein AMAG_06996 [Allomyces macrogynus ATCC 38327]|uniref:Complex 1 LYR protein domain-containing protein n=1 Tax=Allomyces macrogynus (strain ATCC 38327) TaxID=578462 RepID=A0A0L0SFN4_ALLM3|nr:hypothetical protein AMAG_06996 [Allomyces macrogynus ATCC 38327]|eukprot:KNE61249.1 hypothetical protein AMAG_06996 [Allomyces macrogynus ATCC 38327]